MRREYEERNPQRKDLVREETCGWIKLTAIRLITHVATVIPAVTFKGIWNANAGVTEELFGTSC